MKVNPDNCLAVYAGNSRPGPNALKQGARARGFRVVEQRSIHNPSDSVIHGVKWVVIEGIQRDGAKIRDAYRAAGIPVWIMELPRIRTGRAEETADERSHGLYLDSLHYLPPRIGNSAKTLGVIEERTPEYVLVCGQKPNDTAHGMDASECIRWAKETVELCKRQYGIPVVYRPHPQAPGDEMFGADGISVGEPLRRALSKAFAIVTYNSTSGVEAIDAGVPVFYTAPQSEVAYYQYASYIGGEIRNLSPGERETCLLRFAAAQWTEKQLKDGTAVGCLFLGEDWPEPRLLGLADNPVELGDSVTIIGHGSSPANKGWGKEIDSGPVIRMHDVSWQRPDDYGTRTDYMVYPGPWKKINPAKAPDVAWLCYTFGPQAVPSTLMGKPVKTVDVSWAVEKLSPFTPTRGTAAVLMALALGCKTVNLVGFDSVREGVITPYAKGAGHLKRGQKVGDRVNARHDYLAGRDLMFDQAKAQGAEINFWGEHTANTHESPEAALVAPTLLERVA